MEIEDLLYSRLKNYAGLAALVGDRIEPVIFPREYPMPAVTYRRGRTLPRDSQMGVDSGIARPWFEVRGYAESYTGARNIAKQIRLALERWMDDANGVGDTYIKDEFEDYDPEVNLYFRAVVAEVVHREDLP
jgi:hypothetical protein